MTHVIKRALTTFTCIYIYIYIETRCRAVIEHWRNYATKSTADQTELYTVVSINLLNQNVPIYLLKSERPGIHRTSGLFRSVFGYFRIFILGFWQFQPGHRALGAWSSLFLDSDNSSQDTGRSGRDRLYSWILTIPARTPGARGAIVCLD